MITGCTGQAKLVRVSAGFTAMDKTAATPKNTSTRNHRRSGQAMGVPGYFIWKALCSRSLEDKPAQRLTSLALPPRDGTDDQRAATPVPKHPRSTDHSSP